LSHISSLILIIVVLSACQLLRYFKLCDVIKGKVGCSTSESSWCKWSRGIQSGENWEI